MTRRFLFLGLAAAVMAMGGMNARAGQVTLPTPLGSSDPTTGLTDASGVSNRNTTQVGNLTFSDFTYTVNPSGTSPSASGVTLNPLANGIEFTGAFRAGPEQTVDYAITYTVTALSGTISSATLSAVGGTFSGTGSWDVSENIITTGSGLHKLDVSSFSSSPEVTVSFPAETSITIKKDIILVGGSNGATVSIADQTFGSVTIPEPASMALLGIGLSGLFTFRRFLKRALVA